MIMIVMLLWGKQFELQGSVTWNLPANARGMEGVISSCTWLEQY